MSFDPYYEWLGIPPDEQPPDHYRLLGIRRFESNAKVIENAAERQLLLLKTFQNGPHGPLTQQMMNEVAAARVCLLNDHKRARYDAELSSSTATQPPPRKSARPPSVVPGSDEQPEFKLQPPSSFSVQSASPTTRGQSPSSPRRRSHNLAWANMGIQVAIGGVAAVCVVIVVLWIFWGHDPFGIWQRGADQRQLAKVEQVRPRQRQYQKPQRSPARQPEKSSAQNRRPLVSIPGEGVDRGTDMDRDPIPPVPQVDPPPLEQPGTADDAADHPPMSAPLTAPADTSDSTEPSPPPADISDSTEPPPPAQPPEPSDPFSGLRPAIDLEAEATGQMATGISLGELRSAVAANWQLHIEDYGSPLGLARFEVNRAESAEGVIRWTLSAKPVQIDAESGTDADSASSQPEDVGVVKQTVAHVEAVDDSLRLRFLEQADGAVLRRLRVCSLVVEDGEYRHAIQFSIPQHIAPLEVAFDDSKQEVTLENSQALAQVSTDRVALEIVQVTVDQNSAAANLIASLNEEVVVTLEANLEMQLGLRLVESDQQFRLVLMPRTTISGRRRPLVPVDLEKESAKAKAQLVENRRELATAGNQLKSLPAEIRRVSRIKPGTPQEASMRQGRLNQLEKIGKSLQSKVRRLSEADPKLSKSIEQLDQIQQSLTRMNGQVRVQFRVYATGNAGDFQLLGTETEKLAVALR